MVEVEVGGAEAGADPRWAVGFQIQQEWPELRERHRGSVGLHLPLADMGSGTDSLQSHPSCHLLLL